jgi:hypothetical protein
MRSDADPEDKDGDSLKQEGTPLDEEATRLWKLVAAVDQAQNDLLKRMQAMRKASSIQLADVNYQSRSINRRELHSQSIGMSTRASMMADWARRPLRPERNEHLLSC